MALGGTLVLALGATLALALALALGATLALALGATLALGGGDQPRVRRAPLEARGRGRTSPALRRTPPALPLVGGEGHKEGRGAVEGGGEEGQRKEILEGRET